MSTDRQGELPEGTIPPVRAFNRELAPAFIDHACITNGYAPPPGSPLGEGVGAGFAYCELHCGSAVTATLLAGSNPLGDFHVIDARAPMIEAARALARDGEVRNISFHQAGIEAALEKTLPLFDYIVANGIYAWVPLRERALILSFARKFLKPGGAIWLSYNARPGWNKLDPFRRIFREALRGKTVDTHEGLRQARELYSQMFAARPIAGAAAPNALSFLDELPPDALIADFANDFAEPLYVTDVAADFAAIDCILVGAADMSESLPVLLQHEPFRSLVPRMPTPAGRELAKDFLRDTMLRRDVFVRGGKRIAADNSDAVLQGLAFALEQPAALVRYDVPASGIKFDNPEARALVAALEQSPRTLGELVDGARQRGEEAAAVFANIHALLQTGQARPVYRANADAAFSARRLREAVRARAALPEGIGFLPSPFGTAFAVPVADQLFMGMGDGTGAESMAAAAAAKLPGRSRQVLARRARSFFAAKSYYASLGILDAGTQP